LQPPRHGAVRRIEKARRPRQALTRLREDYKNLLRKEGKATPASFKELTGLSRKYIIPLMEYFDVIKLTVRSGDHRLLREKGN